jgi:hypothetical protein
MGWELFLQFKRGIKTAEAATDNDYLFVWHNCTLSQALIMLHFVFNRY